jgi:general nucleoside transport system ATP-binding protein
MAIASGLYRPDAGAVLVDGERREFHSALDGIAAGITMVHQHFMLIDRLTVAENIILGMPGSSLLHLTDDEARVAELGKRYGLPVDPRENVSRLAPSQQQRVEILAALYRGSRVLILDEPTSVLAPPEIESLFETVRRLVGEGRSIVFVSHKLDEVLAICDRVSVMRGGRLEATLQRSEADAASLVRLMVGRQLPERASRPSAPPPGEVALRLESVAVDGERGGHVEGVDLDVRNGEILGIGGVEGNGQNELIEAVVGLRHVRAGRLLLHGTDISDHSVAKRAGLGVAYVPEDPRRNGLLLAFSVGWNMGLRHFRRSGCWPQRLLVDFRGFRRLAAAAITQFDIRAATPDRPAGNLSGGNQQKLVLARELSTRPKLLVVVNPTVGLDVGAQSYVYETLRAERDRGVAVLLVSTDLDEVEALSDRIAVMYRGRVVGVLPAGDLSRERVGLLMGGRQEGAAGEA